MYSDPRTHAQPAARRPAAGWPIVIHALSRPQWLMALAVVLAACCAAWFALKAEMARRDALGLEPPAVPALAPGPALSIREPAAGTASASEEGPGPMEAGPGAMGSPEAPVSGPAGAPAATAGAGTAAGPVAGAAPWLGSRPAVVVQAVQTSPFDEYRLERERLRSRQADGLQAIVHDPAATPEQRQAAQERLLALWAAEALEAQVEHMLRVQGHEALVLVSGSGAHVVVDGVLDAVQAQAIGELVARVAGVRREAVSIVDGASAGR